MELQSTALPTELRGGGSSHVDSNHGWWIQSPQCLTNYTIGASDISLIVSSSLSPFMNFIHVSETEKRPADVLATIIGTTLKYTEYTRPRQLANMLRFKNA